LTWSLLDAPCAWCAKNSVAYACCCGCGFGICDKCNHRHNHNQPTRMHNDRDMQTLPQVQKAMSKLLHAHKSWAQNESFVDSDSDGDEFDYDNAARDFFDPEYD